MVRQDVDNLKSILLAAPGGNFVSKDGLFAEVVHERREYKFRILGIGDRPSREASSDGDDVCLSVASIHSKRVEFHHFAAVIFIEAVRETVEWPRKDGIRLAVKNAAARRKWTDLKSFRRYRLPVVETVEHCRMACGGQQKILEMPEHVRADRIAFVASDQKMNEIRSELDVLVQIHVEVVVPEVDQDLFELPLGIDGAEKFGLLQIIAGNLTWSALELSCAPQFRKIREAFQRKERPHGHSLVWIEVREKRSELILVARSRRIDLILVQQVRQLRIPFAGFHLDLLLAHLLQFGGLVFELRRIGEHIRGQTGQYFLALVGRQRLQHFSPLFGCAVHDLADLI